MILCVIMSINLKAKMTDKFIALNGCTGNFYPFWLSSQWLNEMLATLNRPLPYLDPTISSLLEFYLICRNFFNLFCCFLIQCGDSIFSTSDYCSDEILLHSNWYYYLESMFDCKTLEPSTQIKIWAYTHIKHLRANFFSVGKHHIAFPSWLPAPVSLRWHRCSG